MKRVYFIFNLHSGKAALNNQIPKLLDQFTAAGYEVTVHPTQRQGDGIVSAKYACEHGFDLLVCAGVQHLGQRFHRRGPNPLARRL